MKQIVEARLRRIREMDAFLAARLEVLLGVAAVSTVTGLGVFLWYAIVRGHGLWIIALDSAAVGLLIGIPIGRFFMPRAVEYLHELAARLEASPSPGSNRGNHPV